MRNVAYHNRMDLFTMAVILNHLGEPRPVGTGDMVAADAPVPAPSTDITY
jgi:hypothetical protein